MAYTKKDLKLDLIKINKKISDSVYRFESEGRNNYTALELYKNGVCRHLVAAGTPKDCKLAALDWIFSHASKIIIED